MITVIQPSTDIPLPPTSEEERISWLRLLRSHRVGPVTFTRLLNRYPSAEDAIRALPDIARAAGLQNYRLHSNADAEAEYERGRTIGATLIARGEPAYPADLAQISDAPPLLWVKGQHACLHRPAIAIVGARNASSLGLGMASDIAKALGGAGFTVVSGLARGIDAAAHQATIGTGTIAVLAGGIDRIYPAEHGDLAQRITGQGVLISENPLGVTPRGRDFPRRNRIVSGLSKMVVVVEAAPKSGSLITARYAADQGREVGAVPGHPRDGRAAGCNMLLRDGAVLVRHAADIMEVVGTPENNNSQQAEPMPDNSFVSPQTPPTGDSPHQRILERLGPTPLSENQLQRDLAMPISTLSHLLTELEMRGEIVRHRGGQISLNTCDRSH